MRRRRIGIGRCTRGAAAVEFAIVSGVLVMLLIGIIDLGRVLYVKNQISFLADRAARRVLIQPNVTGADLSAALRAQFSAGNPDALTITVTDETAGSNEYKVVTVDFPITLFIPFLDSNSLSLSVTRRIPTG